ncbi:MAG: glycosyltransferase family 2 protein, partial [Desulfobacteraceae bacterium]
RISPIDEYLSLIRKAPPKELLATEKPIDIIIPVYNGFDFLDNLFKSIFTGTEIPFRLIIIEDGSSDERVRPFIEAVCGNHPEKTILIQQPVNKGFVNSINTGIQHVENHFVIMNTDIEVPPGWLSRLMKPIFQDETIASTTPFSNAADIISFPEYPQNNPLYKGLPVETLDKCFQYLHADDKHIEIPTGVGFCMGMNKTVVDRIGLFDAVLFQNGYCEENDWCMRAGKAGYRNIIVPNLFVYHKQGGSFLSAGKKKGMEQNYWRLVNRHKEYLPSIFEFTVKDPLRKIRQTLKLLVALKAGNKRPILFIGDAKEPDTAFMDGNTGQDVQTVDATFRLYYNPEADRVVLQHASAGSLLEMEVPDGGSIKRWIDRLDIQQIISGETQRFYTSVRSKNLITALQDMGIVK